MNADLREKAKIKKKDFGKAMENVKQHRVSLYI